jgi:Fic-DOC domain mobile mystery protein B
MGLDYTYSEGQTPIDPNESEGLLIPTISTMRELDEFEQNNIEDALQWLISNRFKTNTILSINFLHRVHKKMFCDVWNWAGIPRSSSKNLGVDFWSINTELQKLIDDTKYWIEHNVYIPDEIALRFKHRLVSIHCYPNGNGRHSRIMADIIIGKIFNLDPFSWGGNLQSNISDTRKTYLNAIRSADNHNFAELLSFARS